MLNVSHFISKQRSLKKLASVGELRKVNSPIIFSLEEK